MTRRLPAAILAMAVGVFAAMPFCLAEDERAVAVSFFTPGASTSSQAAPGSSQPRGFVVSQYACGKAGCYWETPMDITDTEAIWRMLTAPITVIDGHERKQVYLLDAPREDGKRVAEITCASQGVHVLETLDNGWSKIECYSSSFHGSKVKAWNAFAQGYVPTELLKEQEVKTTYGLVVDKLTQRLYVFKEGEFLDALAVSTGKPNQRQPYNETRSGEFLLTSRVGGFPSDNLICAMGIRFNNGDLLHEVPHVLREDGDKYYGSRETNLGKRASHGCIRVQRKLTPAGLNMQWLWKALSGEMGTRLVVWEDAPGRSIPIPDGDTQLYWNSKTKKRYHRSPNCYNERESAQPTIAFPYAQLDTPPYAELEMCPSCYPPLRVKELEEINTAISNGQPAVE